jgi:hypothetical protein
MVPLRCEVGQDFEIWILGWISCPLSFVRDGVVIREHEAVRIPMVAEVGSLARPIGIEMGEAGVGVAGAVGGVLQEKEEESGPVRRWFGARARILGRQPDPVVVAPYYVVTGVELLVGAHENHVLRRAKGFVWPD